jgi:pimeloyl-ACP methyl ester carboxylesterase
MLQEHTADIRGRRLRYLVAGSGRPVVLLHAFPLSADMWRPQLERVPEGWRFLAPDLRGLGPTGGPAAATLDDMAGDVAGLLDVLGIERAAIGGLSMGGYVTFALFRRGRERFTAMILANTRAAADSEEGRAAREKMSVLVREKGAAAVADQMLPKLLGPASHASRPELAARVRALIEANPPEGIDGAIQAMKSRPDSTPLLAEVACPALVLTGDEDALIPGSESAAMQRLLPRAQLVTIPGAGHLSSMEAPEAFSSALENFLRAPL